MENSGAGGKLIHEKNQKQKISWHCHFKVHPGVVDTSGKSKNIQSENKIFFFFLHLLVVESTYTWINS